MSLELDLAKLKNKGKDDDDKKVPTGWLTRRRTKKDKKSVISRKYSASLQVQEAGGTFAIVKVEPFETWKKIRKYSIVKGREQGDAAWKVLNQYTHQLESGKESQETDMLYGPDAMYYIPADRPKFFVFGLKKSSTYELVIQCKKDGVEVTCALLVFETTSEDSPRNVRELMGKQNKKMPKQKRPREKDKKDREKDKEKGGVAFLAKGDTNSADDVDGDLGRASSLSPGVSPRGKQESDGESSEPSAEGLTTVTVTEGLTVTATVSVQELDDYKSSTLAGSENASEGSSPSSTGQEISPRPPEQGSRVGNRTPPSGSSISKGVFLLESPRTADGEDHEDALNQLQKHIQQHVQMRGNESEQALSSVTTAPTPTKIGPPAAQQPGETSLQPAPASRRKAFSKEPTTSGEELAQAVFLNSLIVKLTSWEKHDHKFVQMFFAVYRSFLDPELLLEKLVQVRATPPFYRFFHYLFVSAPIYLSTRLNDMYSSQRYHVPEGCDEKKAKAVQLRVGTALKNWIEVQFNDFNSEMIMRYHSLTLLVVFPAFSSSWPLCLVLLSLTI